MAADLAVRTEGLPALQLWEAVLERKVTLLFQEDNAAAIRIIETGKNPTIRHLGRTHRVDLAWLYEQFVSNSFKLMFCETNSMAADLAVRSEGLPALQLWETVLERKVSLLFQEDNAAAIRII